MRHFLFHFFTYFIQSHTCPTALNRKKREAGQTVFCYGAEGAGRKLKVFGYGAGRHETGKRVKGNGYKRREKDYLFVGQATLITKA